jgi:hypothetical protein
MCSVSWIQHDEGYDLFFNRDEQRSRPKAKPPKVWASEEGSYLAPQDPQAGGTWIFTNEKGLTACLLNTYQIENVTPVLNPRSRGLLVKDLARCDNIESLEKELQSQVAENPYSAFYLFGLEINSEAKLWLWDTSILQQLDLPEFPFWTTTSVNPDQVLPYRQQLAQESISRNGLNAKTLQALHLAKGTLSTERTIKMSRTDAQTVSYTHIQVQTQTTTIHYAQRHGDEFSEKVSTQLSRYK